MVPTTNAPMAEKKVSSSVMPNAEKTLYWDSSSPMRPSALSSVWTCRGQVVTYSAPHEGGMPPARVSGRHTPCSWCCSAGGAARRAARCGLGRVTRTGLEARRAEVLLDRLLPLTRADPLVDRVGDLLAERRVALRQADTVVLRGERLPHDLQLALVGRLGGVAGEDRVVGRQRVHVLGLEGVDAERVGVVLLQVDARDLLLDVHR